MTEHAYTGGLIHSRTVSRQPLTIEMNFLRQGEDGENMIKVIRGCAGGTVFDEFIEVWERSGPLHGVPPVGMKSSEELKIYQPKLISRRATGRRFEYVDNVPGERYDEDASIKAETDAMPCFLDPEDFSYHRFRQIP